MDTVMSSQKYAAASKDKKFRLFNEATVVKTALVSINKDYDIALSQIIKCDRHITHSALRLAFAQSVNDHQQILIWTAKIKDLEAIKVILDNEVKAALLFKDMKKAKLTGLRASNELGGGDDTKEKTTKKDGFYMAFNEALEQSRAEEDVDMNDAT